MTTEFDPDEVIRQVTESLVKKFPMKSPTGVEAEVRAAVNELKDSPINDYVAVLAERAVKKKLKST